MRFVMTTLALLLLAAAGRPGEEEDWAAAPALRIGDRTLCRAEVSRRLVTIFGGDLVRNRVSEAQVRAAIATKGLEVDAALVEERRKTFLEKLGSQSADVDAALRQQHLTRASIDRFAWSSVAAEALAMVVGISPRDMGKYLALNFPARAPEEVSSPAFLTVGDGTITVRSLVEELLPLVDGRERNAFLDAVLRAEAVERALSHLSREPSERELRDLEDQDRARLRERSKGEVTLERLLASKGQTIERYRLALRQTERVRRAILDGLRARPPEEVDRILREHFTRWEDAFRDRQVRASHILLKVAPGAPEETWEEVRQRLLAIRAEAVKGADFGDLALQRSEDAGTQARRGDLGFFPRKGAMVEEFASAAFALPKGETSQPVRSAFGWHLIVVTDVRPGRDVTFDAVRADGERDYADAGRAMWESEQMRGLSVEVLWDDFKIQAETPPGK